MKKLAVYVHVTDEDGVSHQFGPNDNVPEWAREKITNPMVWADEDGTSESGEATSGEATEGTGEEPANITVPPKGGPNATVAVWADYAKAKGFAIEGEPTRKEIIEALEAEGIPTE